MGRGAAFRLDQPPPVEVEEASSGTASKALAFTGWPALGFND
jgi:hypothetical protein